MVTAWGQVSDRECVTLESRFVMLDVVRRLTGFAMMTALESACKFNTGYDTNKVLMALSEW
jgi:hypothetical protein